MRENQQRTERYRKKSAPPMRMQEQCECANLRVEIEEGMKSPLMRSPVADRKVLNISRIV